MNNEQMNNEQSIAAHHKDGPMLVLAGPGSGKTHLLVERIRIMIEEEKILPDSILVITFSKKSAVEMQQRFQRLVENQNYPVTFGTFHAVFFNILKQYKHYSKENILTETEKLSILGKIFNDGSPELLPDYISAYKNFGEDFFVKSYGKYMTLEEQDEFRSVYDKYCDTCRSMGKLDFDDMVLMVRDMFMKHESILMQWQKRFRYFLVDEFQDINDAQYDVLRLLAGDEMNVFAVGDDDQSIYAFRGAKPSLMQKFLHQYHGCKRVNLKMNYRCCEIVIRSADNVIKHNKDRISRPIQQHLYTNSGGTVRIILSENTLSQAEKVCKMIKSLINDCGYKYDDIAVLYRSDHCATLLLSIVESANLPVKSHESGINPYTSDIAGIILAYLNAATGKCSRKEFLLIMNNPPRGLSREGISSIDDGKSHEFRIFIDKLKEYYLDDQMMLSAINELNYMIEKIRLTSCYEAVRSILFQDNIFICQNENEEKIGGFFCELSKDFDSVNDLIWFMEKGKRETAQKDNSIIVRNRNNYGMYFLTAHASKGLEFKVVLIIGLQEGLFPHHKSLDGELAEEERRLMYVAMTRAKERLYLFGIGTKHGKRVSRFIEESGAG